jgi:hypothetical protein
MSACEKNFKSIKPVRVFKNISRNYGARHAVAADCVAIEGYAVQNVWFHFNTLTQLSAFLAKHVQ